MVSNLHGFFEDLDAIKDDLPDLAEPSKQTDMRTQILAWYCSARIRRSDKDNLYSLFGLSPETYIWPDKRSLHPGIEEIVFNNCIAQKDEPASVTYLIQAHMILSDIAVFYPYWRQEKAYKLLSEKITRSPP